MANQSPQPVDRQPRSGPAWPIWLAIVAFIASAGSMLVTLVDPDRAVWHRNAWFWWVLLAVSAVAWLALAVHHQHRFGRRMQLALAISLLLHLLLAVILKDQFLAFIIEGDRKPEVPPEPVPTLPDFFLPAPHAPPQPQAYEGHVESRNAEQLSANAVRATQAAEPQIRRPAGQAPMSRRQTLPRPAELTRQAQAVPRRADNRSQLSRQEQAVASIATSSIEAPREALDEAAVRHVEAPEPSAPRLPTPAPRRSRAPASAELRASVASSEPSLHRTATVPMRRELPAAPNRERSSAAGQLAQTRARDVRPVTDVSRLSQQIVSPDDVPLSRMAAPRPATVDRESRSSFRPTRSAKTARRRHGAKRSIAEPEMAFSAGDPQKAPRRSARLSSTAAGQPVLSSGTSATASRDVVPSPAIASLDRAATQVPSTRRGGRVASAMQMSRLPQGTAALPGVSRRTASQVPENASAGEGTISRRQAAAGELADTARVTPGPPVTDRAEPSGRAKVSGPGAPATEIIRQARRGPSDRRGTRSGKSVPSSSAATAAGDFRGSRSNRAATELAKPALAGAGAGTPTIERREALAQLPGSAPSGVPSPSDAEEMTAFTELESDVATRAAPPGGRIERMAGRVPVRSRSTAGPGGLGRRPAATAGINSRRASRQSHVVHDAPDRFLRKTVGGPASVGGQARDIAPAFARRIARRQTPTNDAQAQPAAEVESAIESGLAYLAAIQLADGRWSLQQTVIESSSLRDDPPTIVADAAATGMALLAFLGAGYDHIDDQYRDQVAAGLEFLLAHQKSDGDLFYTEDVAASEGVWFYSHGIAAIALCEAFGMTGDPKLREPAQRALDFIVDSQEPQRGGWRYQPRVMADLSVSGWQLMALRSGQLAGLRVPAATIQRTIRLLDRAQASSDDGSQYVYNPWGNDTERGRFGPRPNTVMTSVGLLMRLYTGWTRTHQAIQRGADRLLEHLPEMSSPPGFAGTGNPLRDTYYWYNATQVMYHMQGEHWQRWQAKLYPMLSATQVQDGPMAGSWDPRQPVLDRWGASAGRLYVTALNLLSLEVYHRHLPLFSEGLAVTDGEPNPS